MELTEIKQSKSWEEEMYWKHFHAMHFYQVLPKDFLNHLALPSKFAEYMANKLPNKVSLIGPSGATWDVEVSKTGGLDFVGDGWKDFAKTNLLEENFLIVFKYKQNLSFEVLIFDQKNSCEKESSYFVKKCSPKPEYKTDKKRCVSEAASTEMIEDNDDGGGGGGGSGCVLSKKPKKGNAENVHVNNPETPKTCPTNNPEAPRTCPSDGFSEDSNNDPDFVVSGEGIDNTIFEVIGRKNLQRLKSCVLNEAAAKDGGGPISTPKDGGGPINTPKSKIQSVKKPGDANTARKLNEPDEMEQTPTENGEKEMFEKVILTPCNNNNNNNNNILSDALSAETMNGHSPPEMIYSRKPGMRRSRSNKRTIPKSPRKPVLKGGPKRLSKEYLSHRREVTSDEKDDAFKRANEACSKGDFIVVMRPTGVYKRFYLSFPAEWLQKNMARQHQKVILRVGEKTWETMFHCYTNRANSGGIGTGWKNFTIHNNLEDSDVCLFKMASKKDDPTLIFDVEIFRVVDEITPLTPLLCSV